MGEIIVLEGIDGVGKTTIAQKLGTNENERRKLYLTIKEESTN